MSAATSRAILAELRRAGAVIQVARGRLRVESPSGVLTPERKRELRLLKSSLLARLSEESRIVGMTLDEFRRSDHAIEVRVPWLTETLWFVPRLEHIDILAREGIARGRIWTAGELADLARFDGALERDAQRIGLLKAKFGARVVDVQAADESLI